MKIRSRIFCTVMVFGASSLIASTSDQAREIREITVRVVDAKFHQPEAGVAVTVLGLSRGPMTLRNTIFPEPGDTTKEGKARGWKFVTDAKGCCTVVLGKFDCWEHLKSTGVAEPGYGVYFLMAEKEGYAGGVSRKILNFNDEDRKALSRQS
ncbi:MAG: hypothetical protein ABI946_09585 [Chthoniobacterales bacterium]